MTSNVLLDKDFQTPHGLLRLHITITYPTQTVSVEASLYSQLINPRRGCRLFRNSLKVPWMPPDHILFHHPRVYMVVSARDVMTRHHRSLIQSHALGIAGCECVSLKLCNCALLLYFWRICIRQSTSACHSCLVICRTLLPRVILK